MNGDAKLEQLAVDPGSAPQRIGLAHGPDEGDRVWNNGLPAGLTRTALPSPEESKPRWMPLDDGIGRYRVARAKVPSYIFSTPAKAKPKAHGRKASNAVAWRFGSARLFGDVGLNSRGASFDEISEWLRRGEERESAKEPWARGFNATSLKPSLFEPDAIIANDNDMSPEARPQVFAEIPLLPCSCTLTTRLGHR